VTSRANRLRRRDSLQKSAAGAAWAGAAIVPRHVLGGAGHLAPSEKVNGSVSRKDVFNETK